MEIERAKGEGRGTGEGEKEGGERGEGGKNGKGGESGESGARERDLNLEINFQPRSQNWGGVEWGVRGEIVKTFVIYSSAVSSGTNRICQQKSEGGCKVNQRAEVRSTESEKILRCNWLILRPVGFKRHRPSISHGEPLGLNNVQAVSIF